MGIRIAFFDIDGTLINFGEAGIHKAVKRELQRIQANGVKLFLATGRPPFFLPVFPGITFDGALCFNGGYCFSGDEVIYSNPIPTDDVKRVIANAEKIGLPVTLTTIHRHGSNGFENNLEKYLQISGHSCDVIDDFQAFLQETVYQMMTGARIDLEAALLEGTKTVKTTRWWDRAVDIIPSNSGKAHAISMILQHYGIRREECIAFGDGGNDMDMIEYAGIGVAMGNATQEVKAVADYVAASCAEDGVAKAIRELIG